LTQQLVPEFSGIDWSVPWLQDVRGVAEAILQTSDWRDALNAAATEQGAHNHRGLPLCFVAQEELPEGVAYEAYISAQGRVPTRSNLHDLFNALVWLRYPQIKRQLNALQAAEIAKADAAPARGRVRDAATIFDENAALIACADPAIADALRNHQWHELFITRREAFGTSWNVHLFGHALMEKLTQPFKAITAHAWIVDVTSDFFGMPRDEQTKALDAMVSTQLMHGVVTAQFSPLPVLGVPGWSSSQDDDFYADPSVFRPKRSAR
jgi:hypothetical protein